MTVDTDATRILDRTTSTAPIVVGVDGSEANRAALRWALDEAARRHTSVDATMVALSLGALDPDLPESSAAAAVASGEERLRRVVEPLRRDDVPVSYTVRATSPVPGLRAEARLRNSPMLVVGRSGHSRLGRLLVGSVTSALAQDPKQPLVVVPAEPADGPAAPAGAIVVGIDGSVRSLMALRWAMDEARIRHARVDAVMAWSMQHLDLLPFVPAGHDNEPAVRHAAHDVLDATIAAATAEDLEAGAAPVEVVGVVRHGDPVEVLLEAAAGADLAVVGTRGMGAIRQHVLGSTSHALLHHCPVPLVIVPTAAASGHDGPVTRP